jgi:hypothetical protein
MYHVQEPCRRPESGGGVAAVQRERRIRAEKPRRRRSDILVGAGGEGRGFFASIRSLLFVVAGLVHVDWVLAALDSRDAESSVVVFGSVLGDSP